MKLIELVPLKKISDLRGSMIAIENNKDIPFEIKRVYYIYDTPKGVSRGFHAHINLIQLAVAVKGQCTFILDNGKERASVVLERPDQGLIIRSHMWREMYDFSDDCVILVLASEHYDESDYIRDYSCFLDAISSS